MESPPTAPPPGTALPPAHRAPGTEEPRGLEHPGPAPVQRGLLSGVWWLLRTSGFAERFD